jgi:hypothetical protein
MGILTEGSGRAAVLFWKEQCPDGGILSVCRYLLLLPMRKALPGQETVANVCPDGSGNSTHRATNGIRQFLL